ncbi:MAG: ABC transporter substrate-binding protein [Geminicoccaceae bacterium]|nr:MAG: ABC transporter substrate-binding protein [Geminicoccaceae bacterium]
MQRFAPNRRTALKLAGAGAFGLATGLGWRPAFANPRGDGFLTASILGALPHLHPWDYSNHDFGALPILTYSNLVYTAPDGSLHPEVAKAMPEISADGLVYTFDLRDDVVFATGKKLTAEDVAYSFELYLERGRRRGDFRAFMESVTIEDTYRVSFQLERPWSGWLMYLTKYMGLLPAGTEHDSIYDTIVGSGPYMVTRFEPDVVIELEAKSDYYMGEALQKKIRLVRIADGATQLANLQTGQVDIIGTCPPKDFAPTVALPEYEGAMIPSAGIFYAPFNRQAAPFDNVHLRRAVASAIDREFICNELYYGVVTPSTLPAAPQEYWYDEELAKVHAYDPDRARFHLREAGMPNGFRFTATIPVPSAYIEAQEAAIIMQANLAEVGIDMRIRQMDFSSMYAAAQNGDFECFPHPSMQPSIEDYLLAQSYMCIAGKQYMSQPCNPAYDEVMAEVYLDNDQERRRPLLIEATRKLVEDCTSVWIGRLNTYHIWRTGIENFEPSYMYAMDLRKTHQPS